MNHTSVSSKTRIPGQILIRTTSVCNSPAPNRPAAANDRSRNNNNPKNRGFVTISRGTASRGKTVVGSHNLIMAYVHIAHDDVVGSHCVMANRVSLAGEVEVGDWAVIGGHVAVHQWTRIGEHTMIQGGALVGKDIPPFITVSNNDPVRFACVNRVGLSRRGFTPETISQIHDACRILFQSGLNYLNGCEEVEKQIPQSPERDRLIRFIRESQRGIIKPYSQSNEKDE